MKFKSIFYAVFSIISILFIQSCDNKEIIDPNNPNNITTSKIQLKLVDSEGDYDQVWVDIIDVKYNRNDDDEGWTSFEGYPVESGTNDRVDLTELIAGTSHVLADEDLESGMLNKIRLVLGETNTIVVELEDGSLSNEIPLRTPSAQQSGLKIHVETDLEAGFSYTFVLDWDVQKSIVKAGNSGNYNLKPVIRAHTEINAGNVSGNVSEMVAGTGTPLDAVTVYAYDESDMTDFVASTYTDTNGDFELAVLPIGTYTLKFMLTDYDDVEVTGIEVNKDDIIIIDQVYMAKSTGSISGKVANSSEIPLGSAIVNAYDKDDITFSNSLGSATTSSVDDDTKGTFIIPNLILGEYILKATLTDYSDGQSAIINVIVSGEEYDAGTITLITTP